jgi:hypothetical protein
MHQPLCLIALLILLVGAFLAFRVLWHHGAKLK